MAKKPVKEALKAKAKAAKAKIKGKLKGARLAILACGACAAIFAGCLDPDPASRSNSATYGDINIYGASNHVTLGDGVLASADSQGSTETQTANPTLDIKTRIDARYNDALAAASNASRSTLGLIGDGLTGVLDLMQSKKSGTVKVTKTDGKPATVTCENGQCSICEDCEDKD